MPRIPVNPPKEFEKVKAFLESMEAEMRKAENAPTVPNPPENCWPIFQLHHQRSRYIYNLKKKGEISNELYRYLSLNRFVDHELACYWEKEGYEGLCCLRCVQPIDSKHGNVCICRVPQRNIDANKAIKCDNCGCRGCSGY